MQKKRIYFSLILLAILINVSGQDKWRFAVLGDTHIGSSDTVAEMIPYMLADNIDCLMLVGDLAEGGKAATKTQLQEQLTEWRSIFTPLYEKKIGVYPVRGNHEADVVNNLVAWNTVFSGNYLLPQNGPSTEMNLSYSFTNKNALFVSLDHYATIHQVNQNWVNQQLETNTLPHVFVFGHEAAFKVFHADCLDDSLVARNSFWQSMTKAGVKTYFCGHDHFVDAALVDDGDGNESNDVYQYLVGTGGGWLMSQYSNYNGTNAPYLPKRIFHEMEYGYALVEVSGTSQTDKNVTITWKKRFWNASKAINEYLPSSNIIQYTATGATGLKDVRENPISVFPNPASKTIQIKGVSGNVKVLTMSGVEIWSGTLSETEVLDVSEYQSGIYFIRNNNVVNKFIVAK
jgi:3',5'-cyclic AMP phosphodiesterase CpdA